MRKLALLILISIFGAGAGIYFFQDSIPWQSIVERIDYLHFEMLSGKTSSSRAGKFLDEKYGRCQASEKSVSVVREDQQVELNGSFFPFGHNISINVDPNTFIVSGGRTLPAVFCKGESWGEVSIWPQGQAIINVVRGPERGIAMRVSQGLVRVGLVRGFVDIPTIQGILRVSTEAPAMFVVSTIVDKENRRVERISNWIGTLKIKRMTPREEGAPDGLVEFNAIGKSNLYWDADPKPIVGGRPAFLYPSGIQRN
jgi:hypothetical protein